MRPGTTVVITKLVSSQNDIVERWQVDKWHSSLDSTTELRGNMRRLGQFVERGGQMVYLKDTLRAHEEAEFINIGKIYTDDVHMFQGGTGG
jgi:hypothetical protein